MTLTCPRGTAWLGPGFFADGQWRRFEADEAGPATLWLADYEGAARAVRGVVTVAVPTLPPALRLEVTLDDAGFQDGVAAIRERIARGDVYQVNLTVRATVLASSGASLLARLCERGVPRFAAWVNVDGAPEFVSGSPELLVALDGRHVRAEPMKGTAAPGAVATLAASEKDQAELAMITDLTRNDLHQLCERGSVVVRTARRFVELPYVVQAVSDVEGVLAEGVMVADVLRVMHPGGSVTGAPRPAAMRLIRELEASPRRLYCGTLGLEQGPSFCAALLIRTATRVSGSAWAYGVGSGITWDSEPQAELAEVRLKLDALKG